MLSDELRRKRVKYDQLMRLSSRKTSHNITRNGNIQQMEERPAI